MMMKAANTPTGSMLEMTIEALRFRMMTMTTIMAMSVSWVSAVSSVPMVSWITPVLS